MIMTRHQTQFLEILRAERCTSSSTPHWIRSWKPLTRKASPKAILSVILKLFVQSHKLICLGFWNQSLLIYQASRKEQRTFNAFLKRYGIKCRKIKRWEDLKIESIRNDCFKELTGDGIQTFYDGQYICHEEIESTNPPFSHVQHQE